MSYETILVEINNSVGVIRLNRPDAMNALNLSLMRELSAAIESFETNDKVGAIIVTGSDKAFAAGADIKEMQSKSFVDVYLRDFIAEDWERIKFCRKPVIAAVAGYALGGGCELALMCDFILAAPNAKFGQPEIRLGIIPGAGGTQRLARSVGKAKTMEMVLTGRMMDAEEAERGGLVSRIVALENLVDEAVKVGQEIASLSTPSVFMAKEAVNSAYETVLQEGMRLERRLFNAAFALEDQNEGMTAFIEKRKPTFENR